MVADGRTIDMILQECPRPWRAIRPNPLMPNNLKVINALGQEVPMFTMLRLLELVTALPSSEPDATQSAQQTSTSA